MNERTLQGTSMVGGSGDLLGVGIVLPRVAEGGYPWVELARALAAGGAALVVLGLQHSAELEGVSLVETREEFFAALRTFDRFSVIAAGDLTVLIDASRETRCVSRIFGFGAETADLPAPAAILSAAADVVLACSTRHREVLVAAGFPHARIDLVRLGATPVPAAPVTKGPNLLFAGDFSSTGGLETALAATEMVRKKFPDLSLRLVGWGGEGADWSHLSKLPSWVVFETDLGAALRAANIVLAPVAVQPDIPRALLHAIASGGAAVVSEGEPFEELLSKRPFTRFVTAGNAAGFAEAACVLWESVRADPARAAGETSRWFELERDWRNVAKGVTELLCRRAGVDPAAAAARWLAHRDAPLIAPSLHVVLPALSRLTPLARWFAPLYLRPVFGQLREQEIFVFGDRGRDAPLLTEGARWQPLERIGEIDSGVMFLVLDSEGVEIGHELGERGARIRTNGGAVFVVFLPGVDVRGFVEPLRELADGWIAPDRVAVRTLLSLGIAREKIQLLPLGGVTKHAAAPRERANGDREGRILSIGFSRPGDPHGGIFEIVAACRDRGIAATAMVVGYGDSTRPNAAAHYSKVNVLAEWAGLEGRIGFSGVFEGDPELERLLSEADVVLLQGSEEAGSCAALRAVAAGVPVVGVREANPVVSTAPYAPGVWLVDRREDVLGVILEILRNPALARVAGAAEEPPPDIEPLVRFLAAHGYAVGSRASGEQGVRPIKETDQATRIVAAADARRTFGDARVGYSAELADEHARRVSARALEAAAASSSAQSGPAPLGPTVESETSAPPAAAKELGMESSSAEPLRTAPPTDAPQTEDSSPVSVVEILGPPVTANIEMVPDPRGERLAEPAVPSARVENGAAQDARSHEAPPSAKVMSAAEFDTVLTPESPEPSPLPFDPEAFEDLIESAEIASQALDYRRAHGLFERAERMNSRDARLLRARAALFLAENKIVTAKKYFERALAIEPNDTKTLCGMGICSLRTHELAEAHAFFVLAVKAEPNNDLALRELLECAERLEKPEQALRAAAAYLAQNPRDGRFGEQIARLRAIDESLARIVPPPEVNGPAAEVLVKLHERAVEELEALWSSRRTTDLKEKAAALLDEGLDAPLRARVNSLLAQVGLLQGDFEAAHARFSDVIRDAPENIAALQGLGQLALVRNDRKQARGHFQQAVAADPNADEAWAGLGFCAWQQGEHKMAWRYFERSLDVNPDNYRALSALVELSTPLKNAARLESKLRGYLERNPDDLNVLYALAGCCVAQNKFTDARSILDRIMLQDPAHRHARELGEVIRDGLRDERT